MENICGGCSACAVYRKSALQALKRHELTQVEGTRNKVTFKKGETLFSGDAPPPGVFCIRKGSVRIQYTSKTGRVHLLRIMEEGELLGLPYILSETDRHPEAIAQGSVEGCFFPKAAILKMVTEDPAFGLALLKQMTTESSILEQRLNCIMDKKTVPRIAEALLFFDENLSSQKWTRRDLAEWSGTTVENVIRTFADFEKKGFVRRDGRKLAILNRKALVEISNS